MNSKVVKKLIKLATDFDNSNLHEDAKRVDDILQKIANENIQKKLEDFFLENPNPSDKKVHEWAEKNGMKHECVEKEIYKMATCYVNLVRGGESKGSDPKDLDEKELKMGIEVEYEHTSEKEDARKIALDHLHEYKHYYTGLEFMEKALELLEKESGLSGEDIKEILETIYKFLEGWSKKKGD